MGRKPKLQSNKMTREQLKETIQVNFELFKDDPDFYEYITTLVIYLMKYEYEETSEATTPIDEERVIPPMKMKLTRHVQLEGLHRDPNRCKYCHGEIKEDARICPYCLSMTS